MASIISSILVLLCLVSVGQYFSVVPKVNSFFIKLYFVFNLGVSRRNRYCQLTGHVPSVSRTEADSGLFENRWRDLADLVYQYHCFWHDSRPDLFDRVANYGPSLSFNSNPTTFRYLLDSKLSVIENFCFSLRIGSFNRLGSFWSKTQKLY